MKKFIFSVILCALTIVNAKAGNGVVSSHAVDPNDASTYIIKGHGNVTYVLGANEKYVFSYDGQCNVYTADGNSVSQNTDYDPSVDYYYHPYVNCTTEPSHANGKLTIEWNEEYYTFDGSTYTRNYNGWDYKEPVDGVSQYYVKGSTLSPISFNQLKTYTGSNNTTYITAKNGSKTLWQDIVDEINSLSTVKNVRFESDGDTDMLISQPVTSAMMLLANVTSLDYSRVYIDEYISYFKNGSYNNQATFANGQYNGYINQTLRTLYLPRIYNVTKVVNGVAHKHVPDNLCATPYNNVKKIVMPSNATCIESKAFTALAMTELTLGDSLRMIGANAFDYNQVATITFPASIEYIGKNAFGSTQPITTDVYFLGKTAPIVEMDAFGSDSYVHNNAHIQPDNSFNDPIVIRKGAGTNPTHLASRENYYQKNTDGSFKSGDAMLHLRSDLTPAERAAYTDITRDYHVFDTYETDGTKTIESSNYTIEYNEDTQKLWVNGTDTKQHIMACYWNGKYGDETSISSIGGFTCSSSNRFYSGVPKAGISGGNTSYYDENVGNQYRWPSQPAYCRSYAVATNNLIWDGIHSIADGIKAAGGQYAAKSYDINCDGDTDDEGEKAWSNGSEYIGSHQFVLVNSDVSTKSTEEWNFENIKGANWYTICVPMNMTVEQVRSTFGEGTQVCMFSNVVRDENSSIRLYFTDERCLGKDLTDIAIQANYPYMIRPSKSKNADEFFTLQDFSLSNEKSPIGVTLTAKDDNGNLTDYKYTFIGQYGTKSDGTSLYMSKYDYYLGNAGNNYHKLFFQVGETGKWKTYTCVIQASDGTADNSTFFTGSKTSAAKQYSFFGDQDDIVCDVTGDSTVDSNDVKSVLTVICGESNDDSDVNGDGLVDIRDLNKIISKICK